jgi:mannan endo-1,4-beta-mannosidase
MTGMWQTPNDVMTYLSNLPTQTAKRVLTGQHYPEWQSASQSDTDYNHGQALLGTTVLTGTDDDYSTQDGRAARLTTHLQAGGLVVLDIHPANPTAAIGTRNISSAWFNGSGAKPALNKLWGSAATSTLKTVWWQQVDRLVAFLNKLPAGAVIIFRPFHEANGSYFWWGKDLTMSDTTRSAQLVQLTLDLKNYLAVRTNLQILWAHAGNGLDWEAPISFGRPTWVDLVGASLYSNTITFPNRFANTYQDLLGTGKPALLFETGPDVSVANANPAGTWDSTTIINSIRANYPEIVGWQGWHETNGNMLAPTENQNSAALFADPWSVNLADLPTNKAPIVTAVHVLGTFPDLTSAQSAYPDEHYINGPVV